ncbi:NADPH-ferredoxin reductase FprA [mine drainage metagenome]|uniref:NADPH-ferredoxin reductase FprA n=1 Tax=mine drainage metagenome TaxID=410659 RepID=A0A1J5R324_9ZZZZ
MSYRIAIVGAGPAGYFTAQALLNQSETQVEVDLFERLPTPWGLVRSGVAPDHPKIKTVAKVFEKISDDPRFRLIANVELGKDVTLEELQENYDAVVFSVGADLGKSLGISGESLRGSISSADFVPWYNGHPDYVNLDVPLDVERAVVIGAGNVAMDVARILAVDVDELAKTDIADHALDALRKSKVEEAIICARRGPEHAAFTAGELRDLLDLEATDAIIDGSAIDAALARTAAWPEVPKDVRQNLEAFKTIAETPSKGREKRIEIRFFLAPREIKGTDRVEAIVLGINSIVDGEVKDTGESITIPCGLVVSAVGYTTKSLTGLEFAKGAIKNDEGRVLNSAGTPVAGLYCVGWAKRGPSGVIGTNKHDASDVVEKLLVDVTAHGPKESDTDLVASLTARGASVVDVANWRKINEAEIAAGESVGRPRIKIVKTDEMLRAAGLRG